MFTRLSIALGLVSLALVVSSLNVSAKGGFDFLTITGPELGEPIQVTDADLTADFFTFANFSEDQITAPADPGAGYEITRHYVQGVSDVIFDRLHYYPETGYVFYDGIENGESEYDGEWYTANPGIKPVFESALSISSIGTMDHVYSKASIAPITQPRFPRSLPLAQLVLSILGAITVILLFAYWLRKASSH